jgi:RNA polymerase subunit RPABC4/transcription elongation factor Spt4
MPIMFRCRKCRHICDEDGGNCPQCGFPGPTPLRRACYRCHHICEGYPGNCPKCGAPQPLPGMIAIFLLAELGVVIMAHCYAGAVAVFGVVFLAALLNSFVASGRQWLKANVLFVVGVLLITMVFSILSRSIAAGSASGGSVGGSGLSDPECIFVLVLLPAIPGVFAGMVLRVFLELGVDGFRTPGPRQTSGSQSSPGDTKSKDQPNRE